MTKRSVQNAAAVLVIALFIPLATSASAQQSETMGQDNGMKQSGEMNKQGNGAGMNKGMKKGMKKGMGQGMGHGMGHGMGKGSMMKMQGMMKMRKKMMGKMFMVRKKPYSNADIKRMVDGRLAKHGFSNLMAGDVADGTEGKPGTAIVNVVSPKGEFLFKVEVNRKNGMAGIVE